VQQTTQQTGATPDAGVGANGNGRRQDAPPAWPEELSAGLQTSLIIAVVALLRVGAKTKTGRAGATPGLRISGHHTPRPASK